jgi:hypothetical protein
MDCHPYRAAQHYAAIPGFGDGDERRTPSIGGEIEMGCRLVLDPGDQMVLLSAKQAKKCPEIGPPQAPPQTGSVAVERAMRIAVA